MIKENIIQEAKKIQGWMKDNELAALYDLTREYVQKGEAALEVGSWKGRSSYVIAQACKENGARLICVDTFTGSENNEAHYQEAADMGASEFMEKYIKKYLAGLPVEYVVKNSLQAHADFPDNTYPLVFIDGNHCDPVISQDLDNYWPKTKSGGLFACHDYAQVCPDVIKAVDRKFNDLKNFRVYESIITFKKPF